MNVKTPYFLQFLKLHLEYNVYKLLHSLHTMYDWSQVILRSVESILRRIFKN